jgi:hypothetical protein
MGGGSGLIPFRVGCVICWLAAGGAAGLGQGVGPGVAAPAPVVVEPVAKLAYGTPGKHVILMENTPIRVLTDRALSTKRSKDGTAVSFTVSEDVVVDHVLVIPRGATVRGEVVEDRKAGRVSGTPELTLKLDSLDLGGESYPVYAYQFKVRGASKEKPSTDGMVDAGFYGALAGGVVAGRTNALPTRKVEAEDMAAGAAVGASAVAAAAVVAPRPVVKLPAESQMDFYLASPLSVQPLGEEEAKALEQRFHSGGPALYVRGGTP